MLRFPVLLTVAGLATIAVGCTDPVHDHAAPTPSASTLPAATKPTPIPSSETAEDKEIRETRAKLSPEDRALVEAQEWCVNEDDQRLGGSMGPPIKLTIKGQPVFICCGGCRKAVEANPDKTLAKVEELKAKKKALAKPQWHRRSERGKRAR